MMNPKDAGWLDEKLKRGMFRAFHRHVESATQEGLFETLDAMSQERMLFLCPLREGERAVFVVPGHEGGVLLVTTRRLIFIQGERTRSVEVREVQRVTVDLVGEAALGHRSKKDWRTLMVELCSGKRESFILEQGVAFWGFLNAVKWLVDRGSAT